MDERRARLLFDKYDENGDGVLDQHEFTNYLTSIFAAMAHTPEFQAEGATPEQMAVETAAQAFADADVNGDGSLTFDEFKAWFQESQDDAPVRDYVDLGNLGALGHGAELAAVEGFEGEAVGEAVGEDGAEERARFEGMAESSLRQAASILGAPTGPFSEWFLSTVRQRRLLAPRQQPRV